MPGAFKKLRKSFIADEGGFVAINTGLLIVPLVAFLGAGVDYSLMVRRKQQMQLAADATALALAKEGFNQTDAVLMAKGTPYFNAMARDEAASLTSAVVRTENESLKKICVKGGTTVQTTFLALFGMSEVPVSAEACTTAGAASFEVALVLDNSGSMAGTKIDTLRVAAKSFVDTMHGAVSSPEKIRISVVPFAQNVKLENADVQGQAWVDWNAQSQDHWSNFTGVGNRFTSKFGVFASLANVRSQWAWKGCFDSLRYPLNTQENAVGANVNALLTPSLAPDSPDSDGTTSGNNNDFNSYIRDFGGCNASETSNGANADSRACKYVNPQTAQTNVPGPNGACLVDQSLKRLSTDKTSVKAKIDALNASGNTNIQMGVFWGWNTLSPVATWKDGYSYDRKDNRKVMIVMTDGDNTWSSNNSTKKSEYSAFGFYTSTGTANQHYAQPSQDVNGNDLEPPTSSNSNTNSTRAYAIMNDLTRRTCENVRAAGITIYTIAFSNNNGISAAGQALMQDCAGDPARYYVANSNTISDVFKAIAQSIGKLRISD
jgi:Flp pilus assembly protein TadG